MIDAVEIACNCACVPTSSIPLFLGSLIQKDTRQLARLSGTPGTVMAAQFTFYVKSSCKAALIEELTANRKNYDNLSNLIWRVSNQSKRAGRSKDEGEPEARCFVDPLSMVQKETEE